MVSTLTEQQNYKDQQKLQEPISENETETLPAEQAKSEFMSNQKEQIEDQTESDITTALP